VATYFRVNPLENVVKTLSHLATMVLATIVLTQTPVPARAETGLAERLHAGALRSLREGRLPEAYGRLAALADAGHAPAARLAMLMCTEGPERFGRDWDCSGEQLQDWAALVGVRAPVLQARQYGRTVIDGRGQPPSTSAMASAVRSTLPVLSPATHMRPERTR